ncbi:type IV pili methyl-accepting chemotaxis transducer N-terminal domain-containing protein [Asticcacaulis sp. BYS171W]|uniref:Type IV pili methyl-accepting chemotaxis transducer N-terminal domain-containing protein n=1 Tax=Asticcacaulis aquaticus TaxID=2984212 RepID=A0ABT5HYZ6_9CAUL|nr:type IV pili methyl-accepting chemotaxis transducer N-terminal domain-containing protein [Asticcacaulis aquaticus]MDC7685302.1 type IV pili methyl-accepting chemotaxis transducer N-terminal domain-containing protein [Asticcacaulis aquaticus]
MALDMGAVPSRPLTGYPAPDSSRINQTSSLTDLVNLAGRQRMLSQRIGLTLMLGLSAPEDRQWQVALGDTVDQFARSHDLIVSGRTAPDQDVRALPALNAYLHAGDPSPERSIRTFIRKSTDLCGALDAGTRVETAEVVIFAAEIAGPVLSCVVGLTVALEQDIHALEAAQARQSTQDRARVMKAAGRIAGAAEVARMISFNARISAARAGEFGREFTALTQEIKTISDDIQSASKDILTYMRG